MGWKEMVRRSWKRCFYPEKSRIKKAKAHCVSGNRKEASPHQDLGFQSCTTCSRPRGSPSGKGQSPGPAGLAEQREPRFPEQPGSKDSPILCFPVVHSLHFTQIHWQGWDREWTNSARDQGSSCSRMASGQLAVSGDADANAPTRHHLASEHFSVSGTAGEQGLLETRPRAEKPAAIKILSWRRAPIQVPYQRAEGTSVLKKAVAPGSTAGQSQSPPHVINLPMLKAQLAGNSAATNAQADQIYDLQSQGYACAHSTSEPFSPKKSGSAKKGLELSGRHKQKYQQGQR